MKFTQESYKIFLYTFTMLEFVGILSGILSASGYIPYIRDILARKTKPERASWLIWTVLTTIAFFTQLAKGASNSLWLPALETCGLTIVLLLSIQFGVGMLQKKDLIALTIAGLGILLWYFTKDATIALYITIGIDTIGTILTVQKAYEKPQTETLSTWLLVAGAGILGMLAVGQWNIVLLSYPVYIFLANGATATAVLFGEKRKH